MEDGDLNENTGIVSKESSTVLATCSKTDSGTSLSDLYITTTFCISNSGSDEDGGDPSPKGSCCEMDVMVVELMPGNCDTVIDLESLDPIIMERSISSEDPSDSEMTSMNTRTCERFRRFSLSGPEAEPNAIPPDSFRQMMGHMQSNSSMDDAIQPSFHGHCSGLPISEDGFIELGNYKISFDVIGSGKLSEVRIAFHTIEKKRYAAKIFSRTKLQKFSMLLRSSRNPLAEVYREVEYLRRLRHPKVIEMKEFIDNPSDDNLYIILELLDRPVVQIPTDSPIPEDLARKYFEDIVSGVHHIHSCLVVHGDIKTDNLLVACDGTVKIADFNSCHDLVLNEDGTEAALVSAIAATPAYTPPECLDPVTKLVAGRPLDCWAIGVSLYAMVMGDVPFKGDCVVELFNSIAREPVIFKAHIPLSASIRHVILRLMDKNPQRRMTILEAKCHNWLTDVQDESLQPTPLVSLGA